MRSVPAGLLTLLNGAPTELQVADLYTVTPSGYSATPPTFMQNVEVDQPAGSQVSWTFVLPGNVTAGSLLVFAYREGTATTVADNQGNTWVKLFNSFWYALNCKAGATTLTVTFSAANHIQGIVAEYQNVANQAPDVSADLVNATSTLATSSSITPTQNGDLILAWGYNATTNTPVYTPGSGYTLRSGLTLAGTANKNLFLEEQVQGNAAAATATLTIGVSVAWKIGIVAFKAAGLPSYRWTDFDADVTISGNTFLHNGPVINRSAMKWSRGLSVEAMEMTLGDDTTDGPAVMIGGVPLLQAFVQRVFDGAVVQLDRAFSAPGTPSWQGPMTMFLGRIGEVKAVGRSQVEFSVNCMLDILNMKMPRNLFQPSCRWTLFDAGCTLNAASFSVAGTVSAGSTKSSINATLAAATGYYNLGRIVFTSGVNNGVTRSIKSYVNGTPSVVTLAVPLPNAPATGDTFTIYAGCDKTQSTCTNRFSNLANYGGEPYIPSPETAI